MRKSKIITIDGLGEVTVKEVSPLAVYNSLNAKDNLGELRTMAADCVNLPSGKHLQNLYPSEIEQIADAFMEVNSSFLAIPAKLGLKGPMDAIKAEVMTILPKLFADSYRQAMATLPGITAGAVS